MISSMHYRSVPHRNKNNNIVKHQANQTSKPYCPQPTGSLFRTPKAVPHDTPLSHRELAKYTPKTIIYDKQTLYFEVQQLKISLNKLLEQNHKLKTRIAISQTERDRLNKSVDKSHCYVSYGYGLQQSKGEVYQVKQMQDISWKLEVERLGKQNQKLSRQLKKIKSSAKYWQIQQKQAENRMFLGENMRLFRINEELRKKAEQYEQSLLDYELITNKCSQLSSQNKLLSSQLEDMHIEIMSLESQLKEYKKYLPVKDQEFQKMILKSKPNHLKIPSERKMQLHDHKRQQRLYINSLKNHRLYPRPLKSIRKEQCSTTLIARHQSARHITTDIFRTEIQSDSDRQHDIRKKMEQTELRLKQLQSKLGFDKAQKTRYKDIAVQTIYSHLGSPEIQEIKLLVPLNQEMQRQRVRINQLQDQYLVPQSEVTLFKQQKKNHLQTDLIFQNIQCSENEGKQYKSQQGYNTHGLNCNQISLKKTLPTQLNIDVAYNLSEQALMPIKKLLTYRFQHQKYTFSELKKDIEMSNAYDFKYVDVCYMLVNQPFFLSVDHSRKTISFLFQTTRPAKDQSVPKVHLVSKFRKLIDDYQPLTPSQQTELIEKCSNIISKNQKELRQAFLSLKSSQNTVSLYHFTQILSKNSLMDREIEFLISQVSIYSESLETLNYQVLFERFLMTTESQDPKREIILQHQDQQNSYLGASTLIKHFQQKDSIRQAEDKHVVLDLKVQETQIQPHPETPTEDEIQRKQKGQKGIYQDIQN